MKETTYTFTEFLQQLEAKNADHYTYEERKLKRYAAECGTILTIPKDLTINKNNYRRYLIFAGACLINFNTVYAEQIGPAKPETLLPFLQFSLRLSLILAAARILTVVMQFIISGKAADKEALLQFVITTGKSIAELICMLLLPQVMNDLMVLLPIK